MPLMDACLRLADFRAFRPERIRGMEYYVEASASASAPAPAPASDISERDSNHDSRLHIPQ
jgi:hypothetical protein